MPTVVAVIALAVVAVAAIVAALLAVRALRRSRASLVQTQQLQAQAVSESAALHDRVEQLERRLARPAAPQEFVITHLGEDDPAGTQLSGVSETRVTLTPPAFADAVLRETAVHTVSLLHGLRRALAPETRHRVRFEMKREIKRSRKSRKLEVKTAVREYRARQRAQAAAHNAPSAVRSGEPVA